MYFFVAISDFDVTVVIVVVVDFGAIVVAVAGVFFVAISDFDVTFAIVVVILVLLCAVDAVKADVASFGADIDVDVVILIYSY